MQATLCGLLLRPHVRGCSVLRCPLLARRNMGLLMQTASAALHHRGRFCRACPKRLGHTRAVAKKALDPHHQTRHVVSCRCTWPNRSAAAPLVDSGPVYVMDRP